MQATVYARSLPTMSAFAFDAQGRLWVTTSAATKHAHDGVYLIAKPLARPVKVVSGLKGPLGLTWAGGKLFVASIGRVDEFSGLRGTHFAQHRLILREPAGHGWNDNLVTAPDGRLVLSISAPCDHCVPTSKWAAAIVSFRPDGKDVRFYATGIRAGYGLAYYPGTSELFVSMNQRNDLGERTPGDWLAVVRQGQDWGFPLCYGQGGSVCPGVPKPIAVLDKHAAAGGVAIVTGSLGTSIGTSALVSEWQLGKVQRISLAAGGTGSVETVLTGLKNPLPLATARDGSVLVGEWGTGRIYRISKRA